MSDHAKLTIVSAQQAESLRNSHAGLSDWARVDALTEDQLEAGIRQDPEWQDLADFDWSGAEFLAPGVKIG